MTHQPSERPGELVLRLIAATMAARTAEVRLSSEPTEPDPASGLDRSLVGVVDFGSGRARLGDADGEETLIIGGALYRRAGSELWTLECDEDDGRTNLTDEGLGMLAFARGVQEVLERGPRAGGGLRLKRRLALTMFFDDMAVSDILAVPTALLADDKVAVLETDDQDRVTLFSMEGEKRSRMKVSRRRFKLELWTSACPWRSTRLTRRRSCARASGAGGS